MGRIRMGEEKRFRQEEWHVQMSRRIYTEHTEEVEVG